MPWRAARSWTSVSSRRALSSTSSTRRPAFSSEASARPSGRAPLALPGAGMQGYIIKRLLSSVVVMWAVVTIVFFAMRLVPADPAQVMLGASASQELIDAFRRKMGLDLPSWQQYANFIVGLLHGDQIGRAHV